MEISPLPPFEISKDPDGTTHAVRDAIQVSVCPDVGEYEVNHRVGEKPYTKEGSRWLHVNLKERGVKIFISGTHVVVAERDYLPTFDLGSKEDILNRALRFMKADKDEAGRYVVDTENNRRVLSELLDLVTERERNRVFSWARYALLKAVDMVK